MSDTTHEAPERIWITGDASKGSWNSLKANFEGPIETEYVRADRIEELEDRVANMAGLWAKSDSEKQLLLGRIDELEAKPQNRLSAMEAMGFVKLRYKETLEYLRLSNGDKP